MLIQMVDILPWIQIGLSVALVTLILLQQSDASVGAAFGGSGGDQIDRSRRGIDKIIFQITIVVAILFALSAITSLFVS